MKPSVLQLTTCLEPGGAEQMILSLARELAPRCDLTVAFLRGPGRLAPAFAAMGVRVVAVGLDRGRIPGGLYRLALLFRKGRFDLVHTHLFHAGLLGRVFARIARVPAVVHTQHNTLTWETGSAILARANRISLRMADRVIAVGSRVAEVLEARGGVPPERIALVHNGVDCARFHPGRDRAYAQSVLALPPDGPLIGAVAGFRPEKGHDTLIEAMILVRKAVGDARLLLIGDGPLRGKIERKIARRALAACVTLAGARDDVDRLIPACDVIALPSWQEGIPVSALEAMACAVPVVATDVGGTTEVVEHGRTGLVVPPGDSRALARAMIELLRAPETARALGKEGRTRVMARFDAAAMTENTASVYDALLAAKGGPALVRH